MKMMTTTMASDKPPKHCHSSLQMDEKQKALPHREAQAATSTMRRGPSTWTSTVAMLVAVSCIPSFSTTTAAFSVLSQPSWHRVVMTPSISTSSTAHSLVRWSAARLRPVLRVSSTTEGAPSSSSSTTSAGMAANEEIVSSSLTSNGVVGAGSLVDLAVSSASSPMPLLGDDGVYHVEDKQQHAALLKRFPDKLIVLKCFAPWCRACKGLEPKYLQMVHDPKYRKLPIVWAELSIQNNKAFVKSLGVLALPTIQFYVAGALTDTFPCGPSKVPILRRKLAALVNEHVDPKTYGLKESSLLFAAQTLEQQPRTDLDVSSDILSLPSGMLSDDEDEPENLAVGAAARAATAATLTATDDGRMTPLQRRKYGQLPFLRDLSLADLDQVLDKARKLTFEPNTVIMREGKTGRTFYILEKGEVEVCQKTSSSSDDMLVARPADYLGTVINRLQAGDYFGERALITGEPRAASIRAAETVTCWAFDKDDFPASSVLSGRTKGTADLALVNDKYGVSLYGLYDTEVSNLLRESSRASQIRGSLNTPQPIRGVDTDEIDVDDLFAKPKVDGSVDKAGIGSKSIAAKRTIPGSMPQLQVEDNAIFSVLRRFQVIRHVSRCFHYMQQTKVRWGDGGIRKRRNMLVSRLTAAQRAEFKEAFQLIDQSNDGKISLLELKRVMESIGDTKSDDELMAIMKGVDGMDGHLVITFDDFMGIMAEAEFYYLFRDIFASLDSEDSGFVKARELDRMLCGVRNLVSDESRSVIDVDDKDMLIDYEQFTRMLIGTTLY